MKKIIRQILDDLSPRSKYGLPVESVNSETAATPIAEQTNNQGEIKVSEPVPGGPNLGNLDQNPKFQAPLPQDLSNQVRSKDPAELVKQLDYQAHESEVEQTS